MRLCVRVAMCTLCWYVHTFQSGDTPHITFVLTPVYIREQLERHNLSWLVSYGDIVTKLTSLHEHTRESLTRGCYLACADAQQCFPPGSFSKRHVVPQVVYALIPQYETSHV